VKSSPGGTTKPLPNSPDQTLVPTSPVSPQPTLSVGPTSLGGSKKTIVILAIVGVIILGIALVLGLFWDKIF